MTERAVPFHCPYCAEEDLRPHGASHGEWECRACLRAFSLKYLGMLSVNRSSSHEPGQPAESRQGETS